ncbi:zinc-ribbon domain-containing protein [Jannaschia aquimarina]|uniref:Zinc finger/thioredoxin putative domain-containing protein n=1 Tax=Jannaschia aquimarina TaxID=935700 RepID=A0A0D1DCW4_9RHOB|nr:zinc-ribbon domain-containing protein [Jannaschia aquimarina]KIT17808.1 hypothetical protein jaqu_03970 [Jannaschia aquimarina]SNS91103.1 MJ0042 family finger-like domain-containing protein [Jannaschia aquimarina]
MRLICPSCGAKYDVAADLIPPEGRDVQCSNCGGSWFQEPEPVAEEALAGADAAPPPPELEPRAPEPRASEPAQKPAAGTTDDAVLEILRQEREYESRARAAEGRGASGIPSDLPETAPDTAAPPDDDTPEERGARERARMAAAATIARSRDKTPVSDPDAPEKADPGLSEEDAAISAALAEAAQDDGQGSVEVISAASRRNLLPDIEEINETLKPDERAIEQAAAEDAAEDAAISESDGRSGFRTGFLAVLLVFIVLIGVYLAAPQLADAIPALIQPLTEYVGLVDQLRSILAGGAESLTEWLSTPS